MKFTKQMKSILRLAALRADRGEVYIDLIEIVVDGHNAKLAANRLLNAGLLQEITIGDRKGVIITDQGRAALRDIGD